jgi:hypothetical protein
VARYSKSILDMGIEGRDMANHVALGPHKIQEAIEAAAKELERLEKKATQLRAFIASGRAYLGDDGGTDALPATPGVEGVIGAGQASSEGHDATQEYTVADWVRKYFEEVGRPMRVPEIEKALVERGWVTSRSAREIIRTAMGRRGEDFERVDVGVYALKEWPPAMKRWPQATAHRFLPRKKRAAAQQESWPQLVYAALNEMGKPLDFKQIAQSIEAKGRKMNKVDRSSVVRAIYRCIEQERLFYLVAPGLFGLREWAHDQGANQTTAASIEGTASVEASAMEPIPQGERTEEEDILSYQHA